MIRAVGETHKPFAFENMDAAKGQRQLLITPARPGTQKTSSILGSRENPVTERVFSKPVTAHFHV